MFEKKQSMYLKYTLFSLLVENLLQCLIHMAHGHTVYEMFYFNLILGIGLV